MKVTTTQNNVLRYINAEKHPNIKLYRYFGNIDYAIKAIAEDTLYFSMSDTFNDPFDCKVVNDGLVFEVNEKDYVKCVLQFADEILLYCNDFVVHFFQKYDFDQMQMEFLKSIGLRRKITPFEYFEFVYGFSKWNDTYENFLKLLKDSYVKRNPVVSIGKRVACFSEVNDSILMWAYYADGHKGVCLEYTPQDLDLDNPEYEAIFNGLRKVYYSETQYNKMEYIHSENDVNSVFFNKALCWAHEQEWRLVLEKDIKKVKFPCLTGVYLGTNFRQTYADGSSSNNFVNLISTVLKSDRQIHVFEAKLDNDKYRLNFEKIVTSGERSSVSIKK